MFTEPVSSWTMSLKRRAPYMLLPAVIWWFGNVPLEHVSARKVANARRSGPADRYAPLGPHVPPHARRAPFAREAAETF